MRRIVVCLITHLGTLTLDVTTLLATAAAIGLAGAVLSLVVTKWPALRPARYVGS